MAALAQMQALEAQIDGGLGELIAVAEARIADLLRRRDVLDREIADYRRRLHAWRGVKDSMTGSHLRLVPTGIQPYTKREAVLVFLNDHPDTEFKLVEIRRGLIQRGLMADDRKSIHALEVAVREMARRNEIRRTRKGFYCLRARGPCS